jgi:hypothetical protein
LIGDERLILAKTFLVTNKEPTPILSLFREVIVLLHLNKESLSEVKQIVEIQEDLVN